MIECTKRPFAHFWFQGRKYKSLYKPDMWMCVCCGVVRPRDPAKIRPCRGVVHVSLRSAS